MSEYTIGAMSLTDDSAQTIHFNLTNVGFPTNAEVTDDEAGDLYSSSQSLVNFSPVATITTKNIATILDNIGLNGQCVGADKTITVADILSRRLETCKSPLTATPHIRDRVTTGLLRLGSLSASRGVDATITAMLDTFTDGNNAPVARTVGVAQVTPIISTRFTLGLCKIAGVGFSEIEDVTLDFNVSITDKSPALGSVWADSAGVLTVRPVLTLRGRDLSRVATSLIELGANAATHANTLIQLIKRQNAASFVDFGTQEHIALTIAGLAVPEMLTSASANGRATNAIRLPAYFDGTNAPVVFDTTSVYDDTP